MLKYNKPNRQFAFSPRNQKKVPRLFSRLNDSVWSFIPCMLHMISFYKVHIMYTCTYTYTYTYTYHIHIQVVHIHIHIHIHILIHIQSCRSNMHHRLSFRELKSARSSSKEMAHGRMLIRTDDVTLPERDNWRREPPYFYNGIRGTGFLSRIELESSPR